MNQTWFDIRYYLWNSRRWYMRIYYYCMNRWIRHGHMLRTTIRPGQYSDKVELIPSALFCAVEDYVSKTGEDAFSVVNFDNHPKDIEIKEKIIQILHFWHIELPELEAQYEQNLSIWGSNVTFVTKKSNRGYYLEIQRKDEEQSKRDWEKINHIEQLIYDRKVEHMKMVVDIHNFLWT